MTMKSQARKDILSVKPYVPGRPIEEVKRELGLKDVIKLASNECPYEPSPKVLKAIQKAALGVNRYPDSGCFYLRRELAKHLKVNPAQLIFGNGSDEIILMAVKAFVDKGDEVVVTRPSFLIYEIAAKLSGAKVKTVPMKNFQYDMDAMVKAVTKKTKIVFLGNPDNPSGAYLSRKQMEVFLKKISSRVLVFIDEAYFEFVTEKDYGNSVTLLKKYPNVLVSRTFSKMYGLAGLRIGYGVASEEVVDLIGRVREPFNVNSLAQAAALAALKDQGYYRKLGLELKKQRMYLYKTFENLSLAYIPTFTNYILVKVPGQSSDVVGKLIRKGVIVRDMAHWDMKGFIRASIGTEKENKKFIRALKGVVK